jgi:maltose O-acetyltransferase
VSRALWHLAVNVLGASWVLQAPARRRLYERCGIRSRTDWLLPGLHFAHRHVSFGERTWINHRCRFETTGPVEIGDGVDLGMQVVFAGDGAVRVEDGCWLGTRSVVLAGVTVGTGCVVASGSVVESDCAPHGLYAGVPARRVRDLPVD